jgi:hypothetical protein
VKLKLKVRKKLVICGAQRYLGLKSCGEKHDTIDPFPAFDGDKSPAESADKSAHSKDRDPGAV